MTIALPRTITERESPAPIVSIRLELDLDDTDAVASFLEAAARCIRDRRRVILTIG